MSGEIEFLEPEPRPDGSAPARPRKRTAAWIAAIGWTAATALAALAPFQRLYGSGSGLPRQYADYLPGGSGSVNGWGNGDAIGPRFGIVLVACAAVCAALAILAWTRALRGHQRGGQQPVGHRVLPGAAVAAPCLLAGVVGTLAIFLASESNPALGDLGFTGYASLNQNEPYSSHVTVAFAQSTAVHSWCLWLAIAAFVCAVVAAFAQSVANRAGVDLAG